MALPMTCMRTLKIDMNTPLSRLRRLPPALASRCDAGRGTLPALRGGPCAAALVEGAVVAVWGGNPQGH